MGRWSKTFAVIIVLVLALLGALQTGIWVQAVSTGGYETTKVTAVDANGSRLATVSARIADTDSKQIVGLSRTGALAPDEGMVFVFDEEARHGFVMRGMEFPLDIVFADADGTVTEIRHASTPGDLALAAQLEEHTGRGKYVLEVNRGWANRTGVDEGDRLRIPGETNATDGGTESSAPCASAGATATATSTATVTAQRPTVTAVDANGTELGSVRVSLADESSERYTGLSNATSLGPNEGMLFLYEEEGRHTYVMRRMDFPLDIVFVDANGTVTTIHHAPVPPRGTEEGELTEYPGTGQYVLEVNRGWTNRTGLDVGDRICSPVIG